jgi:hypothetical protein
VVVASLHDTYVTGPAPACGSEGKAERRKIRMSILSIRSSRQLLALVALGASSPLLNAQEPVLVTYPAIPLGPVTPLEPDLVLGDASGVVFGDVRGVDMTADGTILVLDNQASELREFDLSGRALRTVLTDGQGPREIRGANGLAIDRAGAIWVNDPGNGRFTRLLPDGEVETVGRFVRGWGYRWIGTVTDDGRLWEHWTHADRGGGMPEPGLYRGSARGYLLNLDPETEETDSVFLGSIPVRHLNLPRGVVGIPFRTERLQVLGQTGTIWTALSDRYRLVRMSSTGDTTLVIEAAAEPKPVSADERTRAIARVEEIMQRAGRVSVDWDEVMPTRKPILQHLIVDDGGDLWVQREGDRTTLFDRFSKEGEFLGHYEAAYVAHSWPPTIRNGWLLAVQVDEYDVQSVVGFRLGPRTPRHR